MWKAIDNFGKNSFGRKLIIETQLGKFKKDWKEEIEWIYDFAIWELGYGTAVGEVWKKKLHVDMLM